MRQRLYRGRCMNNDRLAGTLDLFLDKHDEMMAIMDELEMLSPSNAPERVAIPGLLLQGYLGPGYPAIQTV